MLQILQELEADSKKAFHLINQLHILEEAVAEAIRFRVEGQASKREREGKDIYEEVEQFFSEYLEDEGLRDSFKALVRGDKAKERQIFEKLHQEIGTLRELIHNLKLLTMNFNALITDQLFPEKEPSSPELTDPALREGKKNEKYGGKFVLDTTSFRAVLEDEEQEEKWEEVLERWEQKLDEQIS